MQSIFTDKQLNKHNLYTKCKDQFFEASQTKVISHSNIVTWTINDPQLYM